MRHRPCIALDEKAASSDFTRQRRKRQSALNASTPFSASPAGWRTRKALARLPYRSIQIYNDRTPCGHGRAAPYPQGL